MKSYVLITGATGGLGKAFAAECASRGWPLFLTDLSERTLAPLAEGLTRQYGVEIFTHACDLTDPAGRESLWQRLQQLGGRLHLLINNAGTDYEGRFNERTLVELRTIIRLNIEATVEMTRRALPFRHPAGTLRILNVSSLASCAPMPHKAVYAASKRFLLDLSLALRHELAPLGVTLTALCPAGMPTNPETIQGIDAQGWIGQVTTLNVGDVAAEAIDQALKGRAAYVPGFLNQSAQWLSLLLPADWLAYLVGRRWSEARARRTDLPRLPAASQPARSQL